MANNSQRGTSERVREKMLKISEKARAVVDERVLQERVEAVMREERLRAQDVEKWSVKFYKPLNSLEEIHLYRLGRRDEALFYNCIVTVLFACHAYIAIGYKIQQKELWQLKKDYKI